MGGKATVKNGIPILPSNVPISVDALADIKKTIENAAQARDQAAKYAITYTRLHKAFSDAADTAVLLEDSVNEKARQILGTHNVPEEDFIEFDFEKGVIVVRTN